MPDSLLRPGRFDYILELPIPRGQTSHDIISHYMKDKPISEDVILSDIVKVMNGYSCATLENALNIAKTNAVFEGSDKITKKALTDALMQIVYKARKPDIEYTDYELKMTAVHEASHAVVNEVLSPGTTSVVSLLSSSEGIIGMTDYYNRRIETEDDILTYATVCLAGKAGVEVILGHCDVGANSDIDKAYVLVCRSVAELGASGFCYFSSESTNNSESLNKRCEVIAASKTEDLYARAKRIIFDNRDFVNRLAQSLLENETLFGSDIERLK